MSMPRFVLLALLTLTLAACDRILPSPTPNYVVITDPPATAAPPTPTVAPAPTGSGPIAWTVEFIQTGQAAAIENDSLTVARAPFTIRVVLPAPVPVKLNAYITDQNFQDLQPGFALTPDCVFALCTGMDVAEERLNPGQMLFVDIELTHYLYYAGPDDHRWSRVDITADRAVLERDVAYLNDIAIERAADPALYLLFFVNEVNPELIDPGELKKITLLFQ
jgi:hypothetical protein